MGATDDVDTNAEAGPNGQGRAVTPLVTVVVVAHEPGDWFSATLDSLVTQDYPRLNLLVVDASGGDQLAGRVREVTPHASIVNAADTRGFAEAANVVLETEINSPLLLICHDDVALAPDAVRMLVTESLRSNAGIIGPKLVDWENPHRLQHVGLTVDRFGDAVDVVEPGELDQQQYDTVTDVFAIPSACLLIHRKLFEAIGGFDPLMAHRGEDVDLCWRAQLAGARVMVAPDAVVRHRQRIADRVDSLAGIGYRHRLRTMLVNSSRTALVIGLPIMMLLTLGEGIVALFALRLGHLRNLVVGWTWNFTRLGEIRRRRQFTRGSITAAHRDVRALQALGSVRINAFVRNRVGRGDSRLAAGIVSVMRTGTTRFVLLTWAVVALFVLFGSRGLIADGPAEVGDFATLGDSGADLVTNWWGSWHDRDLGSRGTLASGLGLAGFAAMVFGVGVVRTLLVLGPVLVGLVGIWWLLADIGSRRAQMAALGGYVIVPLAWISVASASNSGLVGFAVAPFLLRALLRVQAAAPFGRTKPLPLLGVAVVVALGAMFAPASALLLAIVAAGLMVGSIVAVAAAGLHRLVLGTVVGAVVAALLVLPQTLDVVRGLVDGKDVWAVFTDGRSAPHSGLGVVEIVRFDIGRDTYSPLGWFLAPAVILSLIAGRSWRFDLSVRLWAVALCSWGSLFAASQGWLSFGFPDPALLLAPAAAAVAGLCGLGVATFEHDLRPARFGLRQIVVPVALVGAVVAALPTVYLTHSGRWDLPKAGFADIVPFEDPAVAGSYRVVWIGHPDVLPANGRELAAGMAYVATMDQLPSIVDRDVPSDPGDVALLLDVIGEVITGETQSAGRLLGGLGIRYVVLVERLAPAPFSPDDHAVKTPPAWIAALGQQLDLRRLAGINNAIHVYENTEWTSVRSAAAVGFDDGVESIDDLASSPLSGTAGVLFGRGDRITGPIPPGTDLFVAQTPDEGWSLQVDGVTAVARPAAGWATAYLVGTGSQAELTYAAGVEHRLSIGLQLLGWFVLLSMGIRHLLYRLSGPVMRSASTT